jgi:hypothetical protein
MMRGPPEKAGVPGTVLKPEIEAKQHFRTYDTIRKKINTSHLLYREEFELMAT